MRSACPRQFVEQRCSRHRQPAERAVRYPEGVEDHLRGVRQKRCRYPRGEAGKVERGARAAAGASALIATAKLNNVDPQAWLADVLRRIADHPARRLHELLPWNWQKPAIAHTAAA